MTLLVYLAALALAGWGVAHLVPTRQVVASFGELSTDNRRVLMMEWVAEGVFHIGVACVLAVAVTVGAVGETVVEAILATCAVLLVVVGALTAATGARTPVVWFKICPAVLSGVAVVLLVAAFA